jgi:hypothetical protein
MEAWALVDLLALDTRKAEHGVWVILVPWTK